MVSGTMPTAAADPRDWGEPRETHERSGTTHGAASIWAAVTISRDGDAGARQRGRARAQRESKKGADNGAASELPEAGPGGDESHDCPGLVPRHMWAGAPPSRIGEDPGVADERM